MLMIIMYIPTKKLDLTPGDIGRGTINLPSLVNFILRIPTLNPLLALAHILLGP